MHKKALMPQQLPPQRSASFGAVNGTVMLLGTENAGVSLLAAMLNAHPRIAMVGGSNTLYNLEPNVTRSSFLPALYRMSSSQSLAYDQRFKVEGQWQGAVENGEPYIMGEVEASVPLLTSWKQVYIPEGEDEVSLTAKWLSGKLQTLVKVTGLRCTVVQMIRNPYDSISNLALRGYFLQTFGESWAKDVRTKAYFENLRKGTIKPLDGNMVQLQDWTKRYFQQAGVAAKIDSWFRRASSPVRVITLDTYDFISDPRGKLLDLCTSLGITCTEEYVNACQKIIWPGYHVARLDVRWDQDQICGVMETARSSGLLRSYVEVAPPRRRSPAMESVDCHGMCFPGPGPCACSSLYQTDSAAEVQAVAEVRKASVQPGDICRKPRYLQGKDARTWSSLID